MQPIVVEHRRTLYSELSDVRTFAPGATVADIVRDFPVPAEFRSHGAVYLKRDRHDPGHIVERRYWNRVRPKPGTALFVSCVPQSGGGGKQVFAIIAAIALIALTGWVGAGGLGNLFGLSFLGAGTIGAYAAATAIAVVGSHLLQRLTPTPAGPQDDANSTTLGVAGIGQNTIRPFAQVPAPLGRIRISPPLLARPYTTVDDTDQFIHLICGVCGPAEIGAIKINDTDLADLSADDIQVETREGWQGGEQAVIGTQYDFTTNSIFSFTTGQATFVAGPNGATFTATGTDPMLRTPSGLALDGGVYRYIALDIERTAVRTGGSWEGNIYYNTGGHGENGSFFRDIPEIANQVGARIRVVLDMHDLAAGGDDWATSIVDRVRFDLDNGHASGAFLYRSIKIGHHPEADARLTLIRDSVFEESVNLEMGKHRLANDQTTLINPQEQSYPARHIFRTAANPDELRLTLNFPQGLARFDSASTRVLMAFRVRLRRVGDGGSPPAWRNLPELHTEAAIRGPFRQQLRFYLGRVDEADLVASTSGETPAFLRFYAANTEWSADPYFNAAPGAIDTNVQHVFAGTDRVMVYLDSAEWPRGAYDIEIQRSFAQSANSGQFSGSNYLGGLFTFRNAGPPDWTIPSQAELSASVVIESHATVRHIYPIAQPGLALIAVRAKNLRINSVSAEFEPYVPVPSGGSPATWDVVQPSSNPAALVRWIRTGSLNSRPSDPDLAQGLEDFYDYCEGKGLHVSAAVTDGSVEQAAAVCANVGDAIIRESDKWGVVIDRDRSGEGIQHLFGAHNMTGRLVMQRRYLQGARGIVPQFTDAAQDYAVRELRQPVYDDGVSEATASMLVESVTYDGYSSEPLVRRRAKLDLRRARLRATRHAWECHQEHLVAVHGDLVGLSHDILAYVFGTGRVAAFTTEMVGSPPETYLRGVTLNTEVLDIPEWSVGSPPGLFEVPDMFLVGDIFQLSAPALGLQVRLGNGDIATFPVASVTGGTISIEGDVLVPDGFERTCLAAVGPRTKEVRRVLITAITPRRDHFAQIEAVDEAPAIHAGL